MLAQGGLVEHVRDHVGHQPLVSRAVLAHGHRAPADGRVSGQHGGDLVQLDAEPAQLHLPVGAAHVLDDAVGTQAREVTGAVHPLPRRAERVGDEPFGGEPGTADVAAGELDTGEVQFAGHPRWHRVEVPVQHVDGGVPDGCADRDRRRARPVGPGRHIDRGLGGAVEVLRPDREHGRGAGREVGWQRLTAADHVPQRRAGRGGGFVEELPQHRRYEVDGGDRLGADDPGEVGRVAVAVWPGEDQPRARDQRQEQLPHGHVEAGRRLLQHAVGAGDLVPVPHPQQPVDDGPVRDRGALRRAGGPGRVDHVRGVVRVAGRARDGGGGIGALVEQDRAGADQVGERGRGDHRGRPGVVEDEPDPFARVVDVDRQVGRAGLEHGHQRDGEVEAARQRDRDHPLRPGAPGDQPRGEAARRRVQLREGEFPVGARHRDVVRCAGDLGFDQLQQGHLGHRVRGGAPGRGERVAFRRRQDVDLPDGAVGCLGDGLEHPHQPFGDGLRGGAVEQVDAVAERTAQPVGALVERERQVEPRDAGVDVLRDGVRTGGDPPAGAVAAVPGEHGLEQRVAGHRAGRVEHLHQPLERHVLVGVGGEVGGTHPREQLGERRVAGQVGPQHERVDEQADHVGQRLVDTPGDRGADGDVGARAEPVQQGGECRVDDHEHARPGRTRDRVQAPPHRFRHGERHEVASVGRHGRPRPVGGQVELVGQPVQGGHPVPELCAERAVGVVRRAEHVPLPERVVRVLDGQRRPPRGEPVPPGRVGGGEVAGERAQRPAVGDDVVQDQQHHLLVARQLDQVRPQRRLGGQVEALPRGRTQPLVQVLRRAGGGRQDRPEFREHALERAVRVLAEDRAQCLVAVDHVGERRGERVDVQVAGQPHGDRDVVAGAALVEPAEEPQPALGVRDRDAVRPRPRGDRGAVRRRGDPFGRGGRGGCLEQLAHGQVGAEHRADPVDQPGGEQ